MLIKDGRENMEERKPECYKATCMWSEDACCKCKYDMECYHKFLSTIYKKKEDDNNDK